MAEITTVLVAGATGPGIEINREIDLNKLADLMIEGSKGTKQGSVWYVEDESGVTACAMGAAIYQAAGRQPLNTGDFHWVLETALGYNPGHVYYPMLNQILNERGILPNSSKDVQALVIYLNDLAGKTREEIAEILKEAYKCQQTELAAEAAVSSGVWDGGQDLSGVIQLPQEIAIS